MREQFEGGCLCGAVRFVATGQPKWVSWSHCQSCRKHGGAPVSVFVAFERSAYTASGRAPAWFRCSATLPRCFPPSGPP